MRRGSALVLAIWIIAVLSVMVLSFAFEAHQQAGINVYVRERNRVNRLVEPARMLAETILLGYGEAKEPEIKHGEPDWEEIFEEEDRWCKEKYALKKQTRCKIGPILLDEDDPDSGTVTIDIQLVNSGSENGININNLYDGGDSDYLGRWQQILQIAGVDEELEVEVKEADGRSTTRRNFMNHLIACWNDWRKASSTSSRGPLSDCDPQEGDGAGMKEFYEEYYDTLVKEARGKEEREQLESERYYPEEGKPREIADIKELGSVRGFRDFPAILTGGYLYDGTEYADKYEKGSVENPKISGIVRLLGVTGSSKLVINDKTTIEQLLTIPGIFQISGGNAEDDMEDSRELAQAVLETLWVEPEDVDNRIPAVDDSGRKWWPYNDWSDLRQRVEDASDTNVSLGEDASQYIEWQAGETSLFKMTITCASMGMKREVKCECYVKDKKVRYIEWQED